MTFFAYYQSFSSHLYHFSSQKRGAFGPFWVLVLELFQFSDMIDFNLYEGAPHNSHCFFSMRVIIWRLFHGFLSLSSHGGTIDGVFDLLERGTCFSQVMGSLK